MFARHLKHQIRFDTHLVIHVHKQKG